MKERDLQKQCLAILARLEKQGEPVCGTRTNAGQVRAKSGAFLHLCRAGWPDATFCIAGRFVGFEFKAGTGKQSAGQKDMERTIRAAGGEYILIRTVADLYRYLSGAGIRPYCLTETLVTDQARLFS